jgi:hypothetical protein
MHELLSEPTPDGDVHCYSVKITKKTQDPMAGHPVPDLDWYSESTWSQAG